MSESGSVDAGARRVNVVHTSLHEVRMLGGIPWTWACIGWGLAFAVGLYGKWTAALPIVVFMLWLRWLHREDPHLILVYLAYSTEAHSWDPWPRIATRGLARPVGFCRGMLC